MRSWPTTQNHSKVLRSRARNSLPLPRIITTRTPFSPDRMRKRSEGCHCAQTTKRHRAQTTKPRQAGPRGRGWYPGNPPAPGPGDTSTPRSPPFLRSIIVHIYPYEKETQTPDSSHSQRPRSPRRAKGPADFPCLRQLPPPPLKSGEHQGIAKNKKKWQKT